MNKEKRVYQIDLFRFFAALIVCLFHYLFWGYSGFNMSILDFKEVGNYFKYGYLGVDLFFIISGFVITLSIKNSSLSRFFLSRIVRLYPAYWFCVTTTFIVILLYGKPIFGTSFKQLLANMTMLHEIVNIKSIDGVYWTLLIEIKFYFIIGAYLMIKQKFKKITINSLVYVWLLITVLYAFFNQNFILIFIDSFLILTWSSYFIAGIILYQIHITKLRVKDILILIVCLVISIYQGIERIPFLESTTLSNFSPLIIASIIILFYVLMFNVSIGKLQTINSPKLIKLGLLTYPLYLIHQNIGYIIFNNLKDAFNKYILLIGTLILMIILSFFINKFLEIPISKFIKKTRFYKKA